MKKCQVSKCNICQSVRCNKLEEWLIKRNYNPTVVRRQILRARPFLEVLCCIRLKKCKKIIDLSLLLLVNLPLKIFRMSLMRGTFFWHLAKNIVKFLEINLLWLEVMCQSKDHIVFKLNVNNLQIVKLRLVIGLDAKFVLFLRKLKLLKKGQK